MSKEKSFGIGCFHFGIKKLPPFQFKGSEYIEELKKYLSKIPNLNNLKIETDNEFKSYCEEIVDVLPNLENDRDYFPCPEFFDLEFELYIPFRIQEEIINTKKKFLDTHSENFKITILHTFHSPVAIVEIKNPTKTPDPSIAVRLVREFIKKETNEKSEYIRFEFIGPSPFHIDCYLNSQKQNINKNWLFNQKEILSSMEYNKIFIDYNEDNFKNSDEALDYLKFSIMSEFGYYYSCIQIRNSKIRSWELIQENLENLTQIQKTSGIKGIYKKLFKRSFLIEHLVVDITTLEGQDIIDNGIRQNEYQQIYLSKDEVFFKTFIDRELKEKNNYPTKQATDLISFIESRRVKNLELVTILIAAILGGMIGSLITIYLQ